MTGLGVIHAAGLAGLVYLILRPSLATAILAGVMYLLGGLSITAGYHRLFAHRTYRASAPVRWFFLAFGASTFQNSALSWSADHRAHHADTDGPGDPHSIKKGAWWAHMGWLFYRRECSADVSRLTDLYGVRSIRLQNKYYAVLAIGLGLVAPMAIASLWGDPWGGLLVAGFLRGAVLLQATFCVNSLAHLLGRRRYDGRVSARDSLVTALVTFGEGYHSYHHRFPFDYRNGVHWWQYDPSKWLIWSLSRLHLVSRVRSASAEHRGPRRGRRQRRLSPAVSADGAARSRRRSGRTAPVSAGGAFSASGKMSSCSVGRRHGRRRGTARRARALASAASSTVGSRPRSPGVQNAWTPSVESAKAMPRAMASGSVCGSYQVDRVGLLVAPRPAGAGLDDHHADVACGALGQERLGVGAVDRIGPHPRVDREHHGVEVVAAERLELGTGRAEVVAGDADEAGEPLVAGGEDDLGGRRPLLEDVEAGDAVELVEVQVVGAEALQRPLQVGADAVGVGAIALAGDEQPVADRGRCARRRRPRRDP